MAKYSISVGPLSVGTASITKTLLLLNPNISVWATEVGVSFDGSASGNSGAPGVRVDLYRTTTIGTPAAAAGDTFAAGNSVRVNQPVGAQSACTWMRNLTTEPTAVEVIKTWFVAPAGGVLVVPFPTADEPQASGTSSNRIGLRVVTGGTAPSANVAAYLEYRE